MPSEETLISKLGEIPVLNDGWSMAQGYYSKMKDYNSLTKFTLGVAESGVKTAALVTSPVVTRCQPQIENLNSYACGKLEQLETRYPLMKQPSVEVKEACIDYIQPVVGKVKPVVHCVQGIVDTSTRQVNRVKTCSTNIVVGARDLSVGTVSCIANRTLDSRPGRLMTRTVDGVVTYAEVLVDKYVPKEWEAGSERDSDMEADSDSEDQDGNGNASDSESGNQIEEMEVMEPSPKRVVIHMKDVSNKLRRRMFMKAMRDFRGAKVRTMDAVGKLYNTVDLIDYAKKNMGSAKEKVEDMWEQITIAEENKEDQNKTLFAGNLEERIITLGQMLTHRVRTGVQRAESVLKNVDKFARHPISTSKEYAEVINSFANMKSLQDISANTLNKARATLKHIQFRLQKMFEHAESPELLAMDIGMEGMDICEDDISMSRSNEEHEDQKLKEEREKDGNTTESESHEDDVNTDRNDDEPEDQRSVEEMEKDNTTGSP